MLVDPIHLTQPTNALDLVFLIIGSWFPAPPRHVIAPRLLVEMKGAPLLLIRPL